LRASCVRGGIGTRRSPKSHTDKAGVILLSPEVASDQKSVVSGQELQEVKYILFVDGEEHVLAGLSQALHGLRHDWEMVFLRDETQALELLEKQPVDILVAEPRVRGVDGTAIFRETMQKSPQTVRIVLSGSSALRPVLDSVGLIHQFLIKPCDRVTLVSALSRALSLRAALADEFLRGLVTRMGGLPRLPPLFFELMEELRSPQSSVRKVGAIIAREVGLTAKLLHLVNFAFFGFRTTVTNPTMATVLLGLEYIKSLSITHYVLARFEGTHIARADFEHLENHSIRVALAARSIATVEASNSEFVDHCFTAGLLHDVGKLVLLLHCPQQYRVLQAAAMKVADPLELEYATLGTSHAEVGSYLLGLWGLPASILDAIAYHHRPPMGETHAFSPAVAVHAANAFVCASERGDPTIAANLLQLEFLKNANLLERLDAWQEAATGIETAGGPLCS
jgi:HD-like signal output (HDOD) protein/CheY-like chemotaxis protein